MCGGMGDGDCNQRKHCSYLGLGVLQWLVCCVVLVVRVWMQGW